MNKPKRIKLSGDEQHLLDRAIDADIDFQEHEFLTEVPTICEGTGEDYA